MIVRRFRASNSAVSRVAVSEASQSIRTDEKGDARQVDRVASPSSNNEYVVNQEDEQFEWREIRRGERRSGYFLYPILKFARPARYTSLAYGCFLPRIDCEPVLIFTILVS